MALDRQGDVLPPRQIRRATFRMWTSMAALGAGGCLLLTAIGGGPLLGGAFFASSLALLAWEQRKRPELRRAIALAACGRRDEAFESFAALARKRQPEATRTTIDYWLGNLSWQRGELGEALTYYDRAAARCRRSRHLEVTSWIVGFSRAQLLATRGDIDEARTARAELDHAPPGDYFRIARMLTDLSIAFHSNDASKLPIDLYDWAREALQMSRFGQGVVLLAWAFAAQGDRDMASHMLREAGSRLEASFLAESDTKLHAWYTSTVDDWQISDDDL
jgi:tetratricopeptide (TPR) repeat protein